MSINSFYCKALALICIVSHKTVEYYNPEMKNGELEKHY